jgi:hypothetical protein
VAHRSIVFDTEDLREETRRSFFVMRRHNRMINVIAMIASRELKGRRLLSEYLRLRGKKILARMLQIKKSLS